MFIVCPSCSGPYRIAADQIAPLVQTACPHCDYRVILDFEAANEPSLREAGHQFAQGFESVEAYASVYDHVTSKPDAQPREGVTAVAGAAAASTSARATGTGGPLAATPVNRPLSSQRPASGPHSTSPAAASPAAASSQAGSVRTAGSKTVLQVPSKKPVSMDPNSSGGGDSPSLSGVAGSSMRAGRGVDVVDAPDSPREQEPSVRNPPHTPPTASVVSSGPPPSESPTPPPEDIAAQSGPRLPKVDDKPTAVATDHKPADNKPVVPQPETKSSMTIYIIIVAVIIAVIIALVLMNR